MLMTEHTPGSVNALFPLIAGVGLGMLFHAPYQVFTRALRRQEVASGTSAFFLVRFTGATVGLVSDRVFHTPGHVMLIVYFLPGRSGRCIPGQPARNAPRQRGPVQHSRGRRQSPPDAALARGGERARARD